MNLSLKKFDMRMIKDDKVCVFIGKRETGKSFLVRDLLYHKRHLPVGTVISGTEGANSFYSSIMPPIFIHHVFRPEVLANFMKRQKKMVTLLNKDKKQGIPAEESRIDPRAFIILDDCMYDKSWVNDENVRALFMNGRHYSTLFLITMQYAMGIPPVLRTNVDFVFILRENIFKNRVKLWEQYAGMFPTFDMFSKVMDACTENFECLVINNNAKSNKIQDQVFWYKAEQHEDFKLGHPSIWQYYNQNYSNEEEEDGENEEYDPSKDKKKKGTYLTITKYS